MEEEEEEKTPKSVFDEYKKRENALTSFWNSEVCKEYDQQGWGVYSKDCGGPLILRAAKKLGVPLKEKNEKADTLYDLIERLLSVQENIDWEVDDEPWKEDPYRVPDYERMAVEVLEKCKDGNWNYEPDF